MYLPDIGLIFIHIARTGGTSIETALAGRDWWLISPHTKHLSVSQTRALVGEDAWHRSFKASCVRNPWDRVVSMYATGWWTQEFRNDAAGEFANFLKTMQPHPHEIYNALEFHQILDGELDLIIRYEALQEGFDRLTSAIGLEPKALPYTEKRQRQHYSRYFTEETEQLVRTRFARDIELFGYEFERKEEFDPVSLQELSLAARRSASGTG